MSERNACMAELRESELNGAAVIACTGMVDDVLPRRSELQDPAVANVDQVLLVFALERPTLDLQGATRCLSPQTSLHHLHLTSPVPCCCRTATPRPRSRRACPPVVHAALRLCRSPTTRLSRQQDGGPSHDGTQPLRRFLVSAEAAGLPVAVLLNKADLVTPERRQEAVSEVRATRAHHLLAPSCLPACSAGWCALDHQECQQASLPVCPRTTSPCAAQIEGWGYHTIAVSAAVRAGPGRAVRGAGGQGVGRRGPFGRRQVLAHQLAQGARSAGAAAGQRSQIWQLWLPPAANGGTSCSQEEREVEGAAMCKGDGSMAGAEDLPSAMGSDWQPASQAGHGQRRCPGRARHQASSGVRAKGVQRSGGRCFRRQTGITMEQAGHWAVI